MADNQFYKVLIPTAGIGLRLDNLTKYINKSLISIENKPVISRIIDMFPNNTEFVIALGYKGDIVKQFLSIAYPQRVFYYANVDNYVGKGSGLGLSILECEKYLQEPFVFCSCDTIVNEKIPYPCRNYAGYSERIEKSEYRTIEIQDNKVIKILEKNECRQNSKPYIGLCGVYNWKTFWNEMHNGKDEAIKLGESYVLKKFAENNDLYSEYFTWFDTGNKYELDKTRKHFKNDESPNILPKPDEAIWFIDDKVIKFSDNKNFIKERVDRVSYLKNYVPEIISFSDNMYSYKKADGLILSKITDIDIFKNLLDYSLDFWKKEFLSNEENKNFLNICKNFYYEKTKKRIKDYYEKYNINDKEDIINGQKYPNLSDIFQKINWDNISNGIPCRFHGDFHFENILYNEKNNTFTFLDWRQNFGGILRYGDIYYDLAKLLHGLIICHELIFKDKYSISFDNNTVNYNFERKKILVECENYYYSWLAANGFDVKKVKILTALIYLNIASLHHEPYCHLLYYLGKSMLYDT